MPVTYEKVDEQTEALIADVIKDYHFELKKAKVSISALFAKPPEDDPLSPAVKLHGYPCLAVIRIVPYKQRVQGISDAEITIDHVKWQELHADQKRALIDHELAHLELKEEKKGQAVILARDALG